MNIITTNAKSKSDFDKLDVAIDQETKRRIDAVDGAEKFGVMTAAKIDGEFVLVSNYEMDDTFTEALKAA